MISLLLLYSTTDGHTREIAQFLYDKLKDRYPQIEMLDANDLDGVDIRQYDKILIAASIRYGKFNFLLRRFIENNADILNSKITAFLPVNLIARKPNKDSPETNVYTRKYLRKTKWKPDLVCVTAGMLDYTKYNFIDRNIIRLIMKITGGPTDPTSITEFTDWNKIYWFADKFQEL
jgi:menaquinone-dependent protoporphyrinogen oxidase